MREARVVCIDGLKGLAILLVILIHTRVFGEPTSGIVKTVIDNGDKGVQLFFILSALLLSFSSERQELTPLNFYKKRILRIWPLFACAAIFYAALDQHGIVPSITTLLLLHGFSPDMINLVVPGGWYIGTLAIFYLIYPLLWKQIKSGEVASYWFVASVLIAFVLKKLLWFLPGEFLYFYAPAQLPIFLLGFVVYYFLKEKKVTKTWYLILPIMLGADWYRAGVVPDYLWWGLVWAIVTTVTFRKKFWLIENRIMQALGRASYEMYLAHFGVYYLISRLGIGKISLDANVDAIIRWGVTVFVTYGAAYGIRALISR